MAIPWPHQSGYGNYSTQGQEVRTPSEMRADGSRGWSESTHPDHSYPFGHYVGKEGLMFWLPDQWIPQLVQI